MKKAYNHFNKCRKNTFDKIQHLFVIKKKQFRNKGNFINLIQNIHKNLYTISKYNIICNVKYPECFPPRLFC